MAFGERIQTVVYSLDEGFGRGLLRVLIAGVVVALVLGLYTARQYRGLRDAAGMEWAQLGRNLAAGRGFTTDCLRPADVVLMTSRSQRALSQVSGGAGVGSAASEADTEVGPPVGVTNVMDSARAPNSFAGNLSAGLPDARHAPAYPALLALGFRLLHPSADAPPPGQSFAGETQVVLPLAFLCTLLCGVLVMAVGNRLFDPRVGTTAMVVFAVSSGVLAAGIAGGPTPLEMLLTTASLTLVLTAAGLRARQVHPALWLPLVALGGLAAGAACLTAYRLWVVAVVGVVLICQGFVRWRAGVVALFLVAALGVLAPWGVRNVQLCGNPFGLAPHALLNSTELFEAVDGWDRSLAPTAVQSREVVHALAQKFVRNLGQLYGHSLPVLGDGLVICFFFVALFYRFDEELAGALKWGLTLGLALLMVAAAFGQPTTRDLLPFLPLAIVISVGLLFRLLDQAMFLTDESRQVVVVAWVALATVPLLLTLAGPPAPRPYPPYAPPFIQYVCGLLKPGEVLATDIPWAAAWYGQRPALQLPQTTDDLVALQREGLPVGVVYLTTVTGDRPYTSDLVQGGETSWLPLLNHLVPADFPWQHGFAMPPGRRDQLVLTDAARWADAAP